MGVFNLWCLSSCPPDVTVMLRRRGSHCLPNEEGKRSTINLGVEDLPSALPPESLSKFYTDDDVEVCTTRNRSSSSDNDIFLIREYLRVEDEEKRRQIVSCCEEKDNKLRERRKSLIVVQDGLTPLGKTGQGPCRGLENPLAIKDMSASTEVSSLNRESEKDSMTDMQPQAMQKNSMFTAKQTLASDFTLSLQTAPVPPPRKKRDERRKGVFEMIPSGSSTPSSPTTSSTPTSVVTPDISVTHDLFFLTSPAVTPGTPSTASHPDSSLGSPHISALSSDLFFGKGMFQEDSVSRQNNTDSTVTPDELRVFSYTPETPGSPSSPDSPNRFFTKSLMLEEGAMPELAQRSQTLDNRRSRRRSKVDRESLGQSAKDLAHVRNRQELRRSVSEYNTSQTSGSSNKARRTSSDSSYKKSKERSSSSIRDRFFRPSKKDNSPRALSTRAFNRLSKKTSSRRQKERTKSEDQMDADVEGNDVPFY